MVHLQLDGVEFSPLPSGLHLVEQDVIVGTSRMTAGAALCVFTQRQTSEQGQRGLRLSSLGILLARSLCPCPWRHVPVLKALVRDLHSDSAAQGDSCQGVWEPAWRFFELRKARLEDLGGAGAWHRWSEELEFDMDNGEVEDSSDRYEQYTHASPTPRLPSLPRVLGPSSLTLDKHKHILGRRRIFVYTQPPVEAACFLCQVVADMCLGDQTTPATQGEPNAAPQLEGKHKEGINVLGIITLHDIDMLEHESQTGCGWIACMTDAVFLENPQYYDLTTDLTFYAPTERRKTARLGLQLAIKESYAHRLTYCHSNVRSTWSDVRLWTELDRIFQLDDTNRVACASCIGPGLRIGGRVGVYEEVTNGTNGPRDQWSWAGSPCDQSGHRAHVRVQGDGIEGRRAPYRPHDDDAGKYDSNDEDEDGAVLVRSRQTRTTLGLPQTFHVQTRLLLSRLAIVLPFTASSLPVAQLTPRDLLTVVLGPLSSFDACFVEWLAEGYAGGARVSAPWMAQLTWLARGCRCWWVGRSVVLVSSMGVLTVSHLKARVWDGRMTPGTAESYL
ncbi:hypothetical protein EDB92DRAFT_2114554 [Lactarius akahatsu]|uniref:Uncharacterized protein n=1 Tax=Lactarius akahatsu TaxID=416441 RepID=A0AAD4QDM7_9AGAM|nr:hypothetical protein EDB92DRAFT_2114554 [Lactarius akahatsu]